ncbi:hypothetical protein GW17_00039520 [Ensete ventricosum]|uniref:Uncharacterized protein n=1 Tax=Ensete ventricosum TaxID=4639 RepID=A0A444DHT3_ENSVE|nr:hypothetical protein GW17_00039520 [Ensete ventricosum]RZR70527.1 hypothetical protein BHM03_00000379 [Ensete ventricosum]
MSLLLRRLSSHVSFSSLSAPGRLRSAFPDAINSHRRFPFGAAAALSAGVAVYYYSSSPTVVNPIPHLLLT